MRYNTSLTSEGLGEAQPLPSVLALAAVGHIRGRQRQNQVLGWPLALQTTHRAGDRVCPVQYKVWRDVGWGGPWPALILHLANL